MRPPTRLDALRCTHDAIALTELSGRVMIVPAPPLPTDKEPP